MSAKPKFLHLFEGFGVELEYMIVDRRTLRVKPVCDEVIRVATGEYTSDVEVGRIAWSNELVLHVIELKTNGPAPSLTGLAPLFQESVNRINAILEPLNARLMPTGMHPTMDPEHDTVLWPHEANAIYEAYNRIFGCRGHGWSNVQSCHLNLPFHDDGEFRRLHAAIRALLPILPALAASTPVIGGELTGVFDNRMDAYKTNQRRIPSIAGRIVPEAVASRRDYDERILQPMYRDIQRHDTDRLLQHEWLNSRGAIARFERGTIEIRVLDIQECPRADLTILYLVIETLRRLAAETAERFDDVADLSIDQLARVLHATIKHAEDAVIEDPVYLEALGLDRNSATARQLWRHLARPVLETAPEEFRGPITEVLDRGSLAGRISRALGERPDPTRIAEVYGRLCDCLAEGRLFVA